MPNGMYQRTPDCEEATDRHDVLHKSAKSRPFVVHVHQMHHFYGDLSKEGVQDTAYNYCAGQTTSADQNSKTWYNGCS